MAPKTKNTTFARERVTALLKTNADGSKQFGLRDQHKKLSTDWGVRFADAWITKHISTTLKIRELFAQPTWLGCDSETTGRGTNTELCELAFLRPDASPALDILIKPTIPIQIGASNIHGITNEHLKNSPSLPEVMPQIQSALSGVSAVMWYNKDYDIGVCNQSTFAWGLPDIVWPDIIDVMLFVSAWIGDWNKNQDGFRYARLEGGHRAAGDVREMLDIMRLMASSDVTYAKGLVINGS